MAAEEPDVSLRGKRRIKKELKGEGNEYFGLTAPRWPKKLLQMNINVALFLLEVLMGRGSPK